MSIGESPDAAGAREAIEREPSGLVDVVPAIIARFDRDLRHVFVNRMVTFVTGLPQAHFIGRSNRELGMPPDLCDRWDAAMHEVFETGEHRTLEFPFTTSEGSRTFRSTLAAERSPSGAIDSILAVAHDVTDLRRTEEDLRASQARYRSLFESIDEGFCVVDVMLDADGRPVDYRFLEANAAFSQHTGLVDAVGRTARELVPGLEQHWVDTYGRVAVTGEPIRFQQGSDSMAGRWFDVYAFRVGEPRERRVGILFSDVSEKRRLLRSLEEADRRKDEFLATLAHELRNPLAPLRNHLRVLERGELSARALQSVAACTRQVAHLTRLVDDLLEVARISRGKIELRTERMIVQQGVYGVVESLGPAFDARRHALSLDLPPTPVWIDADPTRFAQIVENLLGNACKYTEPGGAVTVRVRVEPPWVVIEVADTGIGIAAEHLGHVFDLFTQIDTARDHASGGLGIGLALVRQLVELHGGRVEAASAGPGRGAIFTVRLPATALADAA